MVRKRGFWVAIDGIDAVGKTTQTRLVVKQLRSVGRNVIGVEEFSDSSLGETIRSILKKNRFFLLRPPLINRL